MGVDMAKRFFDAMQKLEDEGSAVHIRMSDGGSFEGKITQAGEDYIEVTHEKKSHFIYFNNIISVTATDGELY
jgi:hypothetical protein